jgi:hypothetical protein
VNDLVRLAKGNERKSLAVLKPREITDFVIEPDKPHISPFALAFLAKSLTLLSAG